VLKETVVGAFCVCEFDLARTYFDVFLPASAKSTWKESNRFGRRDLQPAAGSDFDRRQHVRPPPN